MNLNLFEKKIYSQNGEDGIIEEIFNHVPQKNKYFVEFGVSDGRECNTRYLYKEKSWSGLLIECDSKLAGTIRNHFGENQVQVVFSFVTKENILKIFEENLVPFRFDFLSVDMDGNDYWVLMEILKCYKPSVICVEYNAYYPPPEKWVMKYNPNHVWDGTSYYGAGLASLADMCSRFGYGLVATDSNGVNAFFVRWDMPGHGELSELAPENAYHPARYYGLKNNGKYGHPFRDGEHLKI